MERQFFRNRFGFPDFGMHVITPSSSISEKLPILKEWFISLVKNVSPEDFKKPHL